MKYLITTCAAFLLGSFFAEASFKIPKNSFDHNNIPAAVEKATKDKKPIAYLISNKDTTCGLASGSSTDFLKAIGNRCVLVYLQTKSGYSSKLSGEVKSAVPKDKYYPKLIIMSEDNKQNIGSFTYTEYSNDSKGTIKKVKKALQEYKPQK